MARHGQREGLAFYRTPRQYLLQLLDARVGDLRLSEVYDLQVRETIEMRKPSIGDVRVVERQVFKSRKSLEHRQIGIRNARVIQLDPVDKRVVDAQHSAKGPIR